MSGQAIAVDDLEQDPRFAAEVARRTGYMARAAHVSPNTMTRCLHGIPISERTLRAITSGLLALPVLPGVAELLEELRS